MSLEKRCRLAQQCFEHAIAVGEFLRQTVFAFEENSWLSTRPVPVVRVYDKSVAVTQRRMAVRVRVRFRPFPAFMLVLMVFVVHMHMLMLDGVVHMFQFVRVMRRPDP